MGSFVPSPLEDRQKMLEAAGVSSYEELYAEVPEQILLKEGLPFEKGVSELEALEKMRALADQNKVFRSIFRGAGSYHHYIPAIVKRVTSKEEFLTAYTPYQAEISQGILQSIFEYQTMICELTGLDVANASVYDGATAAAEAAAMCRDRGRSKILVSAAVSPEILRTVKTYSWGHQSIEACVNGESAVKTIPLKDGKTDTQALEAMLDKETACVYIQQPNYYGVIEDAEAIAKAAHAAGAKVIMGINPIAAAVLKSPAECGADIAVGEGQPLGMPMGFGGPYLGFMAASKAMMRKLPGRIVGQTVDAEGNRCFVLTLQAREQHIRREKASSNICSNEALCALTAAVYLSAMGPEGLKDAATLCYEKAHYLAKRLDEAGYPLVHKSEFFHEFLTRPLSEKAEQALLEQGILPGLRTEEGTLWCATEMNTKEQIDALIRILEKEGRQ